MKFFQIIKIVSFMLCLPALVLAGGRGEGGSNSIIDTAQVQFVNELYIPPVLEPTVTNGKKVFELTLQSGQSEFFPEKFTQTFGANGIYLMPTIRANNNDQVEFRVQNELGEPTTIHWHGMHLPPSMDGVHQVIENTETWVPHWQIRQEAATLWYHPHLHKESARQLKNGLTGFFIIDDENSQSLEIPQDYGVNDFPLIVQDRLFDRNNQFVHRNNGLYGDTLLVNGTYAPYLEVPQGLVRLRILNASNARRYNFGFDDGREFHLIASDGGFLDAPVAMQTMLLGPGERIEVLVAVEGSKNFSLLSFPINDRHHNQEIRDEEQQFKVLELRPQSTSSAYTAVPDILNSIVRLNPADAANSRSFVLRNNETINNKHMDFDRIDEVVRLGTSEIWEVSNASMDYHTFHVHDVQFQILDRNGRLPSASELGRKDTVLLGRHETVRLIMEFKDYADPEISYMYHCHIVDHEDDGMMGQFLVLAN